MTSLPHITGSSTQVQCFRTRLCSFYLQQRCTRGANCLFAHAGAEVRMTPDLSKTKMCVKWNTGTCRHGANCTYAHGLQELRSLGMSPRPEVAPPSRVRSSRAQRLQNGNTAYSSFPSTSSNTAGSNLISTARDGLRTKAQHHNLMRRKVSSASTTATISSNVSFNENVLAFTAGRRSCTGATDGSNSAAAVYVDNDNSSSNSDDENREYVQAVPTTVQTVKSTYHEKCEKQFHQKRRLDAEQQLKAQFSDDHHQQQQRGVAKPCSRSPKAASPDPYCVSKHSSALMRSRQRVRRQRTAACVVGSDVDFNGERTVETAKAAVLNEKARGSTIVEGQGCSSTLYTAPATYPDELGAATVVHANGVSSIKSSSRRNRSNRFSFVVDSSSSEDDALQEDGDCKSVLPSPIDATQQQQYQLRDYYESTVLSMTSQRGEYGYDSVQQLAEGNVQGRVVANDNKPRKCQQLLGFHHKNWHCSAAAGGGRPEEAVPYSWDSVLAQLSNSSAEQQMVDATLIAETEGDEQRSEYNVGQPKSSTKYAVAVTSAKYAIDDQDTNTDARVVDVYNSDSDCNTSSRLSYGPTIAPESVRDANTSPWSHNNVNMVKGKRYAERNAEVSKVIGPLLWRLYPDWSSKAAMNDPEMASTVPNGNVDNSSVESDARSTLGDSCTSYCTHAAAELSREEQLQHRSIYGNDISSSSSSADCSGANTHGNTSNCDTLTSKSAREVVEDLEDSSTCAGRHPFAEEAPYSEGIEVDAGILYVHHDQETDVLHSEVRGCVLPEDNRYAMFVDVGNTGGYREDVDDTRQSVSRSTEHRPSMQYDFSSCYDNIPSDQRAASANCGHDCTALDSNSNPLLPYVLYTTEHDNYRSKFELENCSSVPITLYHTHRPWDTAEETVYTGEVDVGAATTFDSSHSEDGDLMPRHDAHYTSKVDGYGFTSDEDQRHHTNASVVLAKHPSSSTQASTNTTSATGGQALCMSPASPASFDPQSPIPLRYADTDPETCGDNFAFSAGGEVQRRYYDIHTCNSDDRSRCDGSVMYEQRTVTDDTCYHHNRIASNKDYGRIDRIEGDYDCRYSSDDDLNERHYYYGDEDTIPQDNNQTPTVHTNGTEHNVLHCYDNYYCNGEYNNCTGTHTTDVKEGLHVYKDGSCYNQSSNSTAQYCDTNQQSDGDSNVTATQQQDAYGAPCCTQSASALQDTTATAAAHIRPSAVHRVCDYYHEEQNDSGYNYSTAGITAHGSNDMVPAAVPPLCYSPYQYIYDNYNYYYSPRMEYPHNYYNYCYNNTNAYTTAANGLYYSSSTNAVPCMPQSLHPTTNGVQHQPITNTSVKHSRFLGIVPAVIPISTTGTDTDSPPVYPDTILGSSSCAVDGMKTATDQELYWHIHSTPPIVIPVGRQQNLLQTTTDYFCPPSLYIPPVQTVVDTMVSTDYLMEVIAVNRSASAATLLAMEACSCYED